ncbi:hypothetical protein DL770_009178 [Monosporascus sp. CRB-9-2]|nr:hypothetical protein DL770_009178 [Monosporascus sp. CRB-9-2]
MPHMKLLRVPHLGGIEAAYYMPKPYDRSQPTLILIHGFIMDALGIEKAFVLDTSHSGAIAVRMHLMAPEKIKGIIAIGALMDRESERAHDLGCWDATTGCTPLIDTWTSSVPTPEFEPDDAYCDFVVDVDLGKKIRMAAINLRDRDGLHGRLEYGTGDAVYSVANAEQEIILFKNSPDAPLLVIKEGLHILSHSHPEVVERAVADFVAKVPNEN